MLKIKLLNACLILMIASLAIAAPPLPDAPDLVVKQWITENPPEFTNRNGKVYLIEFWATWCQPCVQSIPHMIELNNKYKDAPFEFISLSQDKSPEKLRKFIKDKNINYHVAIDNGSADWFGIKGYPTIVLIDARGRITWTGFPWSPDLEKQIDKTIADSPPPLLVGVDLGPFDHLRQSLKGGQNFAPAYKQIASFTEDTKEAQKTNIANTIIRNIDQKLTRKIGLAGSIHQKYPDKACDIYEDIIKKYDGIEITKYAKKQLQFCKATSK